MPIEHASNSPTLNVLLAMLLIMQSCRKLMDVAFEHNQHGNTVPVNTVSGTGRSYSFQIQLV